MTLPDPDLRRTWLFGPGADARMHEAMLASGADALILDLEDFTPAPPLWRHPVELRERMLRLGEVRQRRVLAGGAGASFRRKPRR